MCGIVGYVGRHKAAPILMKGLSYLEYRGYDSAGIACLDGNSSGLRVIKEKGKLHVLREKVAAINLPIDVAKAVGQRRRQVPTVGCLLRRIGGSYHHHVVG